MTDAHLTARSNELESADMKAEVFLPEDYRPAEDEPFMNDRQLEYFRRKLIVWKQELLGQSAETIDNLPLLRLIYQPAGEEGYLYQWPATLIAAALAVALLWWLKKLPYRQSAEERLQDALDHQSLSTIASQPGANLLPSLLSREQTCSRSAAS